MNACNPFLANFCVNFHLGPLHSQFHNDSNIRDSRYSDAPYQKIHELQMNIQGPHAHGLIKDEVPGVLRSAEFPFFGLAPDVQFAH